MSRIYITQAGDQVGHHCKGGFMTMSSGLIYSCRTELQVSGHLQFDAGVQLVVPDEPENSSTTLPPWRGDA